MTVRSTPTRRWVTCGARAAARRAGSRIVSSFPDWDVRSAVLEGDPSEELLRRAEAWRPHLIVVVSSFPDWDVRSAVLEGDPSEELLRRAEAWRPHLIV